MRFGGDPVAQGSLISGVDAVAAAVKIAVLGQKVQWDSTFCPETAILSAARGVATR